MEQLYASQSQPVCPATLCVARDRVKVRSRRKYVFTDQIDQLIREIYLSQRDVKTRPDIRLLAKKVGMPHWALKKRARELGLARTKELPWSERELEILARYAWMSDERIRLKLKAAGYSRTATGIHIKLKRMGFKHDGSFYSANGLAQALGIDSHAVTRWIKSGHLKAKLRGTARTEQQNGDVYLIHEKDVRRFILAHDRRDLGTAVGERPPFGGAETEWQEFSHAAGVEKELFEPNLYLYDAYPGGIGFSEPLYHSCQELLTRTRELIAACPCENGCPSCVGPAGDKSERAKEVALSILERLCS